MYLYGKTISVYIFNLILKTSIFPDVWKENENSSNTLIKVIDHRLQIINHNPVSSVSSSQFFISTSTVISVHNCISNCQNGFIRMRSTTSNFPIFTHFVPESVDATYAAIQKAFNQINKITYISLSKLKNYGFFDS